MLCAHGKGRHPSYNYSRMGGGPIIIFTECTCMHACRGQLQKHPTPYIFFHESKSDDENINGVMTQYVV